MRKVGSFSPTVFIVAKSSNTLGLVQVFGLIMQQIWPERKENGSKEWRTGRSDIGVQKV